ncbi:hypothetical protein M3I53_18685 [Paraburkholderia sp. CNPSo 3272]|uniref:hypothetical protein n=1 Tax=Paraburkholderia sp. CNPSo 3272 TaxID=2940931 RepID=UPI0020B7FA70|nr:hypothetical protein [Paraburkholderia sp. CNPSo 3272]MCP3725129.1 hypothetical protein [Paraburkholderia sp. CNPSo 3272]
MDIIDLARASGLTVILDGRIGREEYQSVCGSVSALQRFAESLCQCPAYGNDSASHRSAAASASGRLRGRIDKLAGTAGAMALPARRKSSVGHSTVK